MFLIVCLSLEEFQLFPLPIITGTESVIIIGGEGEQHN